MLTLCRKDGQGVPMPDWKARVDCVAQEIERYLETHPNAADSLEGISTWWVSKQQIRQELEVVRAALEQLTHSGIVLSRYVTDKNEVVYRLNDKHH